MPDRTQVPPTQGNEQKRWETAKHFFSAAAERDAMGLTTIKSFISVALPVTAAAICSDRGGNEHAEIF